MTLESKVKVKLLRNCMCMNGSSREALLHFNVVYIWMRRLICTFAVCRICMAWQNVILLMIHSDSMTFWLL